MHTYSWLYIYMSSYETAHISSVLILLCFRILLHACTYDFIDKCFRILRWSACVLIRLYPHTTIYVSAYDLYVSAYSGGCARLFCQLSPAISVYIGIYICIYIGIHTQVVVRDSSLNSHQRAQAMLAEGKGIWPASGPTFGATEVNTDIYTHIQRERERERER